MRRSLLLEDDVTLGRMAARVSPVKYDLRCARRWKSTFRTG